MAENNTSNIGFEKQIWDAACVLRGNIDASEYKSVVLGLIFLKYISDRFEAKYKELVEEGDGFEEDQDEYTAENIFFVPENARWSAIAAAAHTPEIGTVIDDAMRSIEKENKRLKDILPKNFARPELDKRRLGEVVDLFTNIQMIEHGNSKDILHTGSTGQTELPKERVKALELHLPDNGTLDRFNTLIAPMAAAIVSKQNENNKLATLRDALLPKLMSGEIDVSAVQL